MCVPPLGLSACALVAFSCNSMAVHCTRSHITHGQIDCMQWRMDFSSASVRSHWLSRRNVNEPNYWTHFPRVASARQLECFKGFRNAEAVLVSLADRCPIRSRKTNTYYAAYRSLEIRFVLRAFRTNFVYYVCVCVCSGAVHILRRCRCVYFSFCSALLASYIKSLDGFLFLFIL